MAVEAQRGCGYRKAGGIYLVGGHLTEPCERLPAPLDPCPTCGHKVERSRAFGWITWEAALHTAGECEGYGPHCAHCLVCSNRERAALEPADRAGLIWVGKQHYQTVGQFSREASLQGVCRRVTAWPKDLVVGKTFVLLAHPYAVTRRVDLGNGGSEIEQRAGIFGGFLVSEIEVVVTPTMATQEWAQKLEARGAFLVEVPEDDPDHLPSKRDRGARAVAVDEVAAQAARHRSAQDVVDRCKDLMREDEDDARPTS